MLINTTRTAIPAAFTTFRPAPAAAACATRSFSLRLFASLPALPLLPAARFCAHTPRPRVSRAFSAAVVTRIALPAFLHAPFVSHAIFSHRRAHRNALVARAYHGSCSSSALCCTIPFRFMPRFPRCLLADCYISPAADATFRSARLMPALFAPAYALWFLRAPPRRSAPRSFGRVHTRRRQRARMALLRFVTAAPPVAQLRFRCAAGLAVHRCLPHRRRALVGFWRTDCRYGSTTLLRTFVSLPFRGSTY